MRFADLHNHLLPGVDDGSRSVAETLRHLERFAEQGVVELVMTPHVAQAAVGDPGGLDRRMGEIQRAFDRVEAACSGRVDLPILHLGQELFTPDPTHLDALLRHPAVGLGKTGFLLVEFGFQSLHQPDAVIRLAADRGYRVIVAHPERYAYPSVEDALETVSRWVEDGAFLQVNLGSLSGHYEAWTAGSQQLGWRLLEEGLVHLLASDDHADQRPQLHQRDMMQLVSRHLGSSCEELLLCDNPFRVLRGEDPQLLAASVHLSGSTVGEAP